MARGVQQRKSVSSTVGGRGRQKVSQKSRGQRSRPSPWRTLGWIAAFSGVSLVSAFAGMTFVLMSPFQGTNHRGQRDPSWLEMMTRGFQYGMSRPVNLLVLGVDNVLDAPEGSPKRFRGRTDTMLLARFNPENGTITVLSIPRDTRVEIPGHGIDKINAANVYGEVDLTVRVVSEILNYTPIDRYIRIDTDAFRELVDLVGGVEVNVPKRMVYTDHTQKLYIDLQPGLQTLNGEQAEGFVRFRYDELGDIGRAQRQQMLIKALQKKLANPVMLTQVPKIYSVLQKYVDTDLTFAELMAIAQFSLRIEPDNLRLILLPGRFSGDGYEVSYWLPDYDRIDRVVAEHFSDRPSKLVDHTWRETGTLRIALQNASGSSDAAQDMADFLAHHGYTNVIISEEWYQQTPETEIVAQQGDIGAAQMIRSVLGMGRVSANSTGVLSSDITIRIGRDWAAVLH
ncbi:LCP family protein [Thermosynechococcus sp. PP45]|uniref:LCP family protein n=1 Tax=unclassified Thermosynechococcus TaxID=2622553 RepID=UPI002673CB1F|nr:MULTISPECIES: LCP family protein [unclassified Thermosynechococcus]WKT80917.1 LCP family protein [Thermosynechococcus sp. PP45]WNC24528.1 LCP family protein [Thermosynechococcus sp. PP551]WNC27106.1 LCP family protein [Thermosynechococcus sp. PP555]WNC60050.1 LCP family protein [Thermosynechococcus sp. QS41]